MKTSPAFEFPPEQEQALHKARRLEWWTIAYTASVSVVMYLAMGSSQAMKTAWVEDLLGLIPPVVFLVAARVALWKPTGRFPYGYHRAISIAFLGASLTLFAMGCWLLGDAVVKLATAEHPTIGGVTLFGRTFWLGWLMLPALLWSMVPAVFLGRAKLPLARTMHDKVLHTDAVTNKASWMTAAAAMVGVLGIGLGWWWADAAAAALISLDVIHDGFVNLRQVVYDLMDEVPMSVDHTEADPLPERIGEYLRRRSWIADAQVRMREEGHVYFGEAFVVLADPSRLSDLPATLYEATRACAGMDWRMHDLVLVPVPSLDRQGGDPAASSE
jgi:cation diffusion facilitator family transporter